MAFFEVKKTRDGSSKPWSVVQGELWPGLCVGSCDAATAGKLYHKLSPLKEGVFDTDDWKGYSKVWPTEQHGIGKKHNLPGTIADTTLGKWLAEAK